VAFVLEAFFAEMELEKAGEADTQVRRVYLLKTNYHYSTQKTGVHNNNNNIAFCPKQVMVG
jgi:hypothetical protein